MGDLISLYFEVISNLRVNGGAVYHLTNSPTIKSRLWRRSIVIRSFKDRWIGLMILIAMTSLAPNAMALEHPTIWAKAGDQQRIQKLIDTYPWAADCFNDMKKFIAEPVKKHKEDPAKDMADFPKFPVGIHAHIGKLCLAQQAAIVYFMTGDEDYAQYAADTLNVYVQQLGVAGQVPKISTDGPERDYWELFPTIGLIYDFTHPFLTKPGVTVFDVATQKRIPFDLAKTQLMLTVVLDHGFKFWIEGSNHTIMEGAGLLYCLLCVDDDAKREAYLQTFLKGSKEMTGLNWIKKTLIDHNGIWPESSAYSGLGVYGYVLIDVVNRVHPEYKIFDGLEPTMQGWIDKMIYVYPSEAERVGFGDSHRKSGPAGMGDLSVRIIRGAGFGDHPLAKTVLSQVQFDRQARGYKPRVSNKKLSVNDPLSLFCMDPLEGIEPKKIENQSLVIPYAGLVIQRNEFCADKKQNGLMYYTGGAEYVHSHLSGLDLEVFGAGYVMSPVGGIYAPRSADIFNSYYRSYAGHNTVIVNGTSRGAGKGFWGSQKLMYMDTTKKEALEPAPYAKPVSNDFAFSSQRLDDTVNNAVQQRIVSIVRTSDQTGYYLDLFRSRSMDESKKHFHDYVYHNIGDALALHSTGGKDLPVEPAADRYKSITITEKLRWGDTTCSFPGWHFFTDVKTSTPTNEPITGTFDVAKLKRFMHVAIPGVEGREYTIAKGPALFDAVEPYTAVAKEGKPEKTHAQILSIRHPGDAWDQPFVVIFEPSAADKPTVQSVENITAGGKIVGAKVVSQVGDQTITDRILALDNQGSCEDAGSNLTFVGRFAIARTVETKAGKEIRLYIGDGKKLTFAGQELTAGEGGAAYK